MSKPKLDPVLARAYRSLGVTKAQVESAPRITHLVDKLSSQMSWMDEKWTHYSGRHIFIRLLSGSDEPEARKFMEAYNACAPAREAEQSRARGDEVPIEAYCLAAGVTPVRMFGVAVSAAVTQGSQLSNLIAALNLPKIVEVSAAEAQKPKGVSDREWQLRHSNFLPMPRGSQVNVYASASANAAAQAQSLSLPQESPPEDTIRRLVDRFNEGRGPSQLPATEPALQITEGDRDSLPAMMPAMEQEIEYEVEE